MISMPFEMIFSIVLFALVPLIDMLIVKVVLSFLCSIVYVGSVTSPLGKSCQISCLFSILVSKLNPEKHRGFGL